MVEFEKRDKAYWQTLTESRLPPTSDIIARNAAITGTYATWYTKLPLFKWAGMAAFSSHRVGLALRPYEFHVLDEFMVYHPRAHPAPNNFHTTLSDLDLIRETNNEVFHDIGWAHLAYMLPNGGLPAIEDGLAGDPKSVLMLEGFRMLDQGRRLLLDAPNRTREAEDLIWKANTLLLKHEQDVIVQRQFDKCDLDFRLFLSIFTVMDFNAVYLTTDLHESSSFDLFMWTYGLGLLISMHVFPTITNIKQRWFWIEKSLMPLWKRVEATDPNLHQKLAILMR